MGCGASKPVHVPVVHEFIPGQGLQPPRPQLQPGYESALPAAAQQPLAVPAQQHAVAAMPMQQYGTDNPYSSAVPVANAQAMPVANAQAMPVQHPTPAHGAIEATIGGTTRYACRAAPTSR